MPRYSSVGRHSQRERCISLLTRVCTLQSQSPSRRTATGRTEGSLDGLSPMKAASRWRRCMPCRGSRRRRFVNDSPEKLVEPSGRSRCGSRTGGSATPTACASRSTSPCSAGWCALPTHPSLIVRPPPSTNSHRRAAPRLRPLMMRSHWSPTARSCASPRASPTRVGRTPAMSSLEISVW